MTAAPRPPAPGGRAAPDARDQRGAAVTPLMREPAHPAALQLAALLAGLAARQLAEAEASGDSPPR